MSSNFFLFICSASPTVKLSPLSDLLHRSVWIYVTSDGAISKVQSLHAYAVFCLFFQGQHFLCFGLLILFVRCKPWWEKGWDTRPPALTYVQEPQEWVPEKALRINLQLLQLSRHTLLYPFNHTCLRTINNFNRAHKYRARLTWLCWELSQAPGACVCMGLSSSLGGLWSFPSVITRQRNEVR